MSAPQDTYPIEVAGLRRDLRLFTIKPGVRIAILNILGDTEFVQAVSKALAEKLHAYDFDMLVTPETKSIPLTHALAVELNMQYIVLRKSFKPYMGDALRSETLSITTGEAQTLYLDEKDKHTIQGKRVALVDDVISTGSTLQGMRLIMEKAGATVAVETAILTEGDRARWSDIVALGHLPVFFTKAE